MNNGGASVGQPLPPLASLIKPDQIAKLPTIPEEQRLKYTQGVTKLWESINSQPNDSPEYQNAYKKLIDVTYKIKVSMEQRKGQLAAAAAAAAAQNGVRPQNQQATPDNRPQSQAGPPVQISQEQFPSKILEKVEQMKIVAPPQMIAQNGVEGGQAWVNLSKQKYAQALHRLEQAEFKLKQINSLVSQRTQNGKPLNAQETENFQLQTTKLQNSRENSMEWLRQFSNQQAGIKSQQERTQKGSNDLEPASNLPKQEQPAPPTSAPPSKENSAQMNNSNSTQDVTKKEPNVPGRPNPMSPPGTAQAPNQQMNPPSSTNQQQPSLPANQVPATGVKAEPQSQEHKVNAPSLPPPHPPHHGEPQPLKHEDALERARSYPQAGYPQNPPQAASHGHPPQHSQRDAQSTSHSKLPIPKELNVPPPQPVSMGQSRPTMTGGPLTMGPIGQPAIQRTPGYVLEGDGERVLSKKKLEELVRQVTGGSGPEGEEGETITADVEETLLNVADEFVDQVIVSACKLAKLRQSSTLELRDIQLILERNYNIRVPGYASDELRTVKKIQPAPGWTQKLSAVQAAKVTGGKADL